jgi:hypothetical protein
VYLLLILDYNLAVCGIQTGNSSLNKLDVRSTQYLWKRAPLDFLIRGKLMQARALGEAVGFVHQRYMDMLPGNFASQPHGKQQTCIPRADHKNSCWR